MLCYGASLLFSSCCIINKYRAKIIFKRQFNSTCTIHDMYRTRQALKSLQYSPKGQDIAGLPPKNQKEKAVKMIGSTPIVRQKRVMELTSDEKENPSKRISLQTFNTIGIQCSKSDEDMLCGGVSDGSQSSEYWKIMAFKRRVALNNVNKENKELHDILETLNQENEVLREENKDLLELLDEANDIKELVSEKPEGDSGFAVGDSTQ